MHGGIGVFPQDYRIMKYIPRIIHEVYDFCLGLIRFQLT